jgi:hypothetical protein
MKQITLRGIPEHVGMTIRREAAKKGMSLNKAFIAHLEKLVALHSTGPIKTQGRTNVASNDLDHLAGRWKKKEADCFDKVLAHQRKVDEKLWK